MRRGAVYCLGKKTSISQVVRGKLECVVNLQVSLKKVIEIKMEIGRDRDRDGEGRDRGAEHTYLSKLGVYYFSQVSG